MRAVGILYLRPEDGVARLRGRRKAGYGEDSDVNNILAMVVSADGARAVGRV